MTAYEWPADGSSACSLVEASAQARPNCSDSVGYGHASIFTNSANIGRIIAYFAHELDQTTWSGSINGFQAIFSLHQRSDQLLVWPEG